MCVRLCTCCPHVNKIVPHHCLRVTFNSTGTYTWEKAPLCIPTSKVHQNERPHLRPVEMHSLRIVAVRCNFFEELASYKNEMREEKPQQFAQHIHTGRGRDTLGQATRNVANVHRLLQWQKNSLSELFHLLSNFSPNISLDMWKQRNTDTSVVLSNIIHWKPILQYFYAVSKMATYDSS